MERVDIARRFVHMTGWWPLADVLWRVYSGTRLGEEPIETLLDLSGSWAMWILGLCLLMTPLTQITRWAGFVRARRALGLYSAFYAAAHLLVYLWLDQGWAMAAVFGDFIGRPYQWAGVFAFAVLMALAATSTQAAMRRLKARWKRLHVWVYPAGLAVVLHVVWQAKDGAEQGGIYALALVVLLAWRSVKLAGR